MKKNPFIQISAENFSINAFDIKPLEGFEYPKSEDGKEEFPDCCDYHKWVIETNKNWFEKFPNCCDPHRKLNSDKSFKKEEFDYVLEKVPHQLAYTEHCVKECIEDADWYNAITEYIDFNLSSFGQLRGGYGSPVGIQTYTRCLEHFIKTTSLEMSAEKREALIKFFEVKEQPEKETKDSTDLNILYATYQKWLKIFPFDLSLFIHLKEHFEKQIPILNGKPEKNRYSGISKVKLHTKDSLVETLLKVTDSLLTEINGLSLYEKGLLTEPQQLKLEMVVNERKLKIKAGYVNKSSGEEQRFRKVLKEWFRDEKDFIDEIVPLLKHIPVEELSTKTDALISKLKEYKLVSFLNDKNLKVEAIQSLIDEHSGREMMPFTIALLSELGYLKYFFEKFTKTKKEGHEILSKLFGSPERRIRGNINVLNEGSQENPVEYTSHKHIDIIKESIKGL